MSYLRYMNRRAGMNGRHARMEEEEAGALDNQPADNA